MKLKTTDQFRKPNINDYPELLNYSEAERYDYFIGCGGLYLAAKMARNMNLKKGDVVLDLGCGFGSSSIFLAKTYGVTVIAVDLWFSPDKLLFRILDQNFKNQIIPINIDITQFIPFANAYFDAIFCMNSLFLFGENLDFLEKLLNTLKKGGVFCVGSEGFNIEPQIESIEDIPEVYNFNWSWDVWGNCYSKYHSSEWWKDEIQKAATINITNSGELEDGRILWEDMALNYKKYVNDHIVSIEAVVPQEKIIDQVLYAKKSGLYPTVYTITGIKN